MLHLRGCNEIHNYYLVSNYTTDKRLVPMKKLNMFDNIIKCYDICTMTHYGRCNLQDFILIILDTRLEQDLYRPNHFIL